MIIALLGNPNSGKTTLFNQLTGSNQHVGNFPGVTVEKKEGAIRGQKNMTLVDLPGIYSLSPYTAEEVVTRDFLLVNKPEAVINIVDATNIERNLYLTLQLMEVGVPVVVALNMMDEVRQNGDSIDVPLLSQNLGLPIVPISAAKNEGCEELVQRTIEAAQQKDRPRGLDLCQGEVHRAVHSIAHIIEKEVKDAGLPSRYAATKVVEGDPITLSKLNLTDSEKEIIDNIVREMETNLGTDREAALADMRYDFIANACKDAVKKNGNARELQRSIQIDRVLTHKYFGIPIFLCVMLLTFFLTFNVIGAVLSDWLSLGIDGLTGLLDQALANLGINAAVHSLLIDGVCVGVGSVLSFLPTIVTLFFFLSILEDSGYMARVAFVMDKLLRKIGLQGARGVRDGQAAAQDRALRPVVRADADRLWLLGAGDHGHAHAGQRARPAHDDSAHALHVLLRKTPHLRDVYGRLLPERGAAGDDRAVRRRHGRGRALRAAAQAHGLQGEARSLCHGAARLPLAQCQVRRHPHVGKGEGLPRQGVYDHFHGVHRHLGPAEL